MEHEDMGPLRTSGSNMGNATQLDTKYKLIS
uniref:Uncharacterized protein n=1 Tax=Variovorax paradoxus (strain S110) TaxID=543728 RepID=C5CK76_VARPS